MPDTPSGSTNDPGRYGRNVREVSERVRSGPFSEMRLMSKISPTDLRRGADLAAADVRFRRALADYLEANDLPDIQVSEAIKLRREWS